MVPIFNAAAYLPQVLAAWSAQSTRRPLRFFLVDNNSRDGSDRLILEAASRDPRFIPLHEPKQGAYAARNTGVRASSAPTLVFTDPDCVAEPDWLHELLDGPAGLYGRAADGAGEPLVVMGRDRQAGRGRCIRLLSDYDDAKERYTLASDEPEIYYGHTNNLATRRRTLEAAGGFSERQRGADVLFVQHVVQRFGTDAVAYAPDAVCHHLEVDTARRYFRKTYLYGRSNKLYQQKLNRAAQPLSNRQRWAVFQLARRVHGLSLSDSVLLFHLLGLGVVWWYAGRYLGTRELAADEAR